VSILRVPSHSKLFFPKTAATAVYHIRSLAAIRDHLPRELTHRSSNSLILSRLDYRKSILSGLHKASLRLLPLAQNMAARLMLISLRLCHVSPLIQNLSWLQIEKHIKGKIVAFPYKARNGLAPSYVAEFFVHRGLPTLLRWLFHYLN